MGTPKESMFKPVKKASGGFSVAPVGQDEVGASAPGRFRDAVDSTFRDAIASPSRVQPGGQEDDMRLIPASVLKKLLAELVPETPVAEGYASAFPSIEDAVQAALLDKDSFRSAMDAGEQANPYESLTEMLGWGRKKGK